jgi:hypothetical protein
MNLRTQFLKNSHMFGPSNLIIHGYHHTKLQILIMWGEKPHRLSIICNETG